MNTLRILMTVDPEIPVPPHQYGGIERIVDMVVRGLLEHGHDVSLLAHPASTTPARLVPYRGQRSGSLVDAVRNMLQVWQCARALPRVSVIHSFGRLAYLLPVLPLPVVKVQSYQRHITPRSVRLGRELGRQSLYFTACSRACRDTAGSPGGLWTIIPNGVPLASYTFRATVPDDAPLVFLGRVERIKGAHTAIEVARRTGRRLVIAGNRATSGPESTYFEREIAPACDGMIIRYVGPVTDAQKNDLLGQAAALLFPIEWEEPFGIVMAEALACGTPVLAFLRGAVNEVVEHGVNGFCCASVDALVDAVAELDAIDRRQCRAACEARFSDEVIVRQYERLYYSCLTERTTS
ncbi:MAG: glycosyltransferase [Deltaproteobacteria bacterium]|nr:glycosyltransferase [Deltaproteobacteria bacterium]